MAENISFKNSNILDYTINCCKTNNVIALTQDSIDNFNNAFHFDDKALILGIQTPQMRVATYQKKPWNTPLSENKNDVSNYVFKQVANKDITKLLQDGMCRIHDDLSLTDNTVGTFAILVRCYGYGELAGLVCGMKKDNKIEFVFDKNPSWTLGKESTQENQRQQF